jgi:hypothetical protein
VLVLADQVGVDPEVAYPETMDVLERYVREELDGH